jgi:acetyltransferase
MEAAMFAGLSDQSVCLRFLGYRPRVTHDFLSRLTHIDYDREMAIIAEIQDVDSGQKEMAGVVRIIADCWGDKAEFAIIVADKFQGQSLGSRMVDYSLEVARDKGIRIVHAFTLRDNTCMIQMLKNRGFSLTLEEDAFCAELDLEHAMPFATQLPFQPMTNY